jgi:hypothetical protein
LLHFRARRGWIIRNGRCSPCPDATALTNDLILRSLEVGRLEKHQTSHLVRIDAGEAPNVFTAPRVSDQNIWRRDMGRGEQRVERLRDVWQRRGFTVEL